MALKVLKMCLTTSKHLSHNIVNELCNLISYNIKRSRLDDFKSQKAISEYAVLADEIKDSSGIKQMTVCFRWVDKNLSVHENFMGLFSLKGIGQSSDVITKSIKDVLMRCNMPFKDFSTQGYDGTSSMSGSLSGVAQRVKEFATSAHHVHCLAHCLNLTESDASKNVLLLQTALDITHKLVSFIKISTKRRHILYKVKLKQKNEIASPNNSMSLRSLCPTWWTVKASAIESVIHNYKILLETLD